MKSVGMLLINSIIILMVLFSGSYAEEDEDFDFESKSESCTQCHTGDKKDVHAITQESIDLTVHEGTYCLECHTDLKNEVYSEDIKNAHPNTVKKVQCSSCHEDASAAYVKHGLVKTEGNPSVPSCKSCHGTHNILEVSDTNSLAHETNLLKTCSKCHEHFDDIEKFGILNNSVIGKYQSSVHGLATPNDTAEAAKCKDCHFTDDSAHKIYSPGEPTANINHFNIPKTCGKCHEDQEKKYWDGIHGKLTARGEVDAPVCTSCHGEHTIAAIHNEKSSVNHSQLARATCTPCHNSAALTAKFGIDPGTDVSYIDEYHGKKSGLGDTTAANCASCHNAHDIRTQRDRLSRTNAENLVKTCGTCHEDITQEIAETRIHKINKDELSWWENLFTIIYIIIIALTVGGMIFYVILDFVAAVRASKKGVQVKRMSRGERIQHGLLALTFIILGVTGFALRYSDSFWAEFLFGRSGGFWIRHQIHVVSASILVATCLYHVIYLKTKRGTFFIKSIFPQFIDAKQAYQMITYNLGIGKIRPEYNRFTFAEKFEYWALVWGMLIMTLTGIVLWYDSFFVEYIPKEAIDVMRVVHYYEAWLASLAILIWHFYGVIFNPHIYPMNTAWLTGTMTKKQYDHEHGADENREEISDDK